ncbi:UNVERIFIED_CONTAM: hypothetical protein FKN15_021922 [Acipenser sinensis]
MFKWKSNEAHWVRGPPYSYLRATTLGYSSGLQAPSQFTGLAGARHLDLKRKTEIHEIEERKNGQINTLMKNHEKAFSDIKNYYNDITLNNLALINSLKEQVEEMKRKEERLEKEMAEVQLQNKRLTEPLQKAREEVTELQKQLANYQKDKVSLAGAKARLKVADKEMKDLKWEHEVLEQRFSKVQDERDELYQKFIKAIHEVQQKSGFKNLLLERKLHALTDTLEKKEVQLNEVLSASNLDPTALTVVTRKLEDILDSKNNAIKDLQYELARVCKAHNDLLRTYETKLRAFGIPVDELGFKPLESTVAGQTLGQGPAGLGAYQACDSIKGLEVFNKTCGVKVDPDKPLEGVRFATLQGVKEYSVPIGLDAKVQVDLVVVGSVAVSEKGWRIGKGEGFADMEYAMMVSMGAVSQSTIVVTIVHDCQVVDIPEELVDTHDLTVDYILTPSKVIETECKHPNPKGIIWSKVIDKLPSK